MENWLIAIGLGVIAIVISFVDCIGADHLHKRALLIRIVVYLGFGVFTFGSGWFAYREYHGGDLEPKHAANKAEDAQPDKVAHAKPLPKPKTKPSTKVKTPKVLDEPPKVVGDPTTHKHPTPAFILKTIEDAPPVAQQKVKEQFIGVPVSWDGRLTGSTKAGNTILIHVSPDDPGPTMSFRVPIELPKHNFLLQAKKGTHLHIEAVIEDIPGRFFFMTLKDPSVVELKSDAKD